MIETASVLIISIVTTARGGISLFAHRHRPGCRSNRSRTRHTIIGSIGSIVRSGSIGSSRECSSRASWYVLVDGTLLSVFAVLTVFAECACRRRRRMCGVSGCCATEGTEGSGTDQKADVEYVLVSRVVAWYTLWTAHNCVAVCGQRNQLMPKRLDGDYVAIDPLRFIIHT